jgi:hypothetical protein
MCCAPLPGPGCASIARLLAALRDLDTLGEALARRARRGLTRWRPLVVGRPPAAPACSLAAPAPAAADSS